MTTEQLLHLMRTLSALESWAFAQGKTLPDYLHDDICAHVATIEREILKGQK